MRQCEVREAYFQVLVKFLQNKNNNLLVYIQYIGRM